MLGKRAKAALGWTVGFGAAYAAIGLLFTRGVEAKINLFHAWWWTATTEWPGAALFLDRIGHGTMNALALSGLVLFVATGLGALGVAGRIVVRARVRAGGRDALAFARGWAERHPRWARVLSAAPASLLAVWCTYSGTSLPFSNDRAAPLSFVLAMHALYAFPAVLAALGWTALTRAGVRALSAPVIDEAEAARSDVAPSELAFDAVAVTRETRAAIGLMGTAGLAMAAWAATLSTRALFHDPRVAFAMAGYVALALGSAALFRRASRVAIGLDGVYVTGSSRTRFHAYRDVDDARASGDDIVLLRGARVVLRLQLHGKDASRRAAVTERLEAAIRRAKEAAREAATGYVTAASKSELARVAQGAAHYRAAALGADKLWELVEGPAIDAETRTSAAAALVRAGDAPSRVRLRVAADRCADPRVRVALQRLSEGDVPEDERDDEPAVVTARRAANR